MPREHPRNELAPFGRGIEDVTARDRAAHAQDQVEACDAWAREPHRLAQAPAQPVAVDRMGNRTTRDDVADPSRRAGRRRGDQLQEAAVEARAAAKNSLECARTAQAIGALAQRSRSFEGGNAKLRPW